MADDDASIFIGNVDPQITERVLYELLVQMGPLESLHLALDDEGASKGFAFCVFQHKSSADYAIRVLDTVRLFNRSIRVNRRRQNENPNCKVFVGGLSYDCREEELHDLFAVFGSIDQIVLPKECESFPFEASAKQSVACPFSVADPRRSLA